MARTSQPDVWTSLLRPGLCLLDGGRAQLRAVGQELAHFVVHNRDGAVLWVDGDHGFNPYDFAETNMERGFQADHGAERVLIKRCMTPFQWDTVLTQHLGTKLAETHTSLVLVLPFDRLFSTDELQDWEREDYIKSALRHLRDLARRHRVPILLGVDMRRWARTHMRMARWTGGAVQRRFRIGHPADGTLSVMDLAVPVAAPRFGQTTLLDFLPEDEVNPLGRGVAGLLAER